MGTNQPKSVKPKMRGRLRSGVTWQRALKQKGVKQTGVKQGLGIFRFKRGWYEHIGETCIIRNFIVVSFTIYQGEQIKKE
jgi:cobalamin biosynthesis Co2+ chelatase CbiK